MPGLEMKYFVLKPKAEDLKDPYARASRRALQAYAYNIELDNPELARQLTDWVDSINQGGN